MIRGRSFEDVRASLHHDRFKNEFLASVGYYPTDVGNEKRGDIMRAAIAGNASRQRLLKRGCAVWKEIGSEISDFLGSLPQRYGFVLSEQYHREHGEVKKALAVIDDIVVKIEAARLEETDIETFWDAADRIGGLLWDMTKSLRFGEYVLDIDSRLIQEDDRA